MSIWDVLEIPETSDIKTIKRAYAVRLKEVKPDDDPKGFQRLHEAYKSAQKIAKYNHTTNDNADELIQIQNINNEINVVDTGTTTYNTSGNDAISTHQINFSYDEEVPDTLYTQQFNDEQAIDEQISDEQQELDRVLSLVDKLLLDECQRNVIKSWGFISSSTFILDTDFNWQLGLSILKKLLEIDDIKTSTLNYLNSLFNWKDDEEYICDVIEDKWCKTLLLRINDLNQRNDPVLHLRGSKSIKKINKIQDKIFKQYYFSSDARRMFALLIDLCLIFFVMHSLLSIYQLLFGGVEEALLKKITFSFFIILYSIYTWSFETSYLQSTPGKFLLGLRVTDKNFMRIRHLRYFFRLVIMIVTSFMHIITVFINALMNQRYLHDRVSGTYVIDYRRSKKEHEEYYPE